MGLSQIDYTGTVKANSLFFYLDMLLFYKIVKIDVILIYSIGPVIIIINYIGLMQPMLIKKGQHLL